MIDRLLYLTARLAANLLARLPFGPLYSLSGGLYVVLYYLVRYRRKVVAGNMQRAFPDKTVAQRLYLERQFYRYFCDLLLESVKLLRASPEAIIARCRFKNMELLKRYHREGRSVAGVVGHCGNWELGGLAFSLLAPHQVVSIYKKQSNVHFDRWLKRFRSRFGAALVPMEQVGRAIVKYRDTPTMTLFLSDQTPAATEHAYWTRFLNQDTPVFTGLEKVVRKTGDAVVFCKMQRVKRGHYEVTFMPLNEKPQDTAPNELTEQHTRMLEQCILEQPWCWLWSHRRWKHRRGRLRERGQDSQ